MGDTIRIQIQQTRGENTMRETHTEAQGKTTNPMDNQQETKEKILRVKTGALSVLSHNSPTTSHITTAQ